MATWFGRRLHHRESPPIGCTSRLKKLKAIIPFLDDGLEFYSVWLGRHHPFGFPRTATKLIRTTTRAAHSAVFAEIVRPFVMATWNILIATEDSRMKVWGAISQINSYRQ
jgi:hypothetical protein